MQKGKILIFVMFLLILTSFSFANLDTGLVSYYNFDSDATDSVSSNDGTVSGASLDTTDKKLGAGSYEFDHNADWIDLGNTLIPATGDFTLSFWVRTDIPDSADSQGIVAQYTSGETGRIFNGIRLDGKIDTIPPAGDSAINKISGTGWHLVVWTRTGSDANVYVDNVLAQSHTISTAIYQGTNTLIGGDSELPTSSWDGNIDEVGFWNKVLTSDERTDLYNGGDGASYPFTTTTTITAKDSASLESILTFNATVNSTLYQTTNGTIYLPYLTNESNLVNITVNANNYFEKNYTNYNISSSLVASLDPEMLQDFVLLTPSNTKTNASSYDITWTEAVSPTSKEVTYNVSSYYVNSTLIDSYLTQDLNLTLDISGYNSDNYFILVNAEENITGTNYTQSSILYVDQTNYIYFKDAKDDSALTGKSVTVLFNNSDEVSYTTDSLGKIEFQSFKDLDLINGITYITYLGTVGYVSPITFEYNAVSLPFNITYNISRANLTISVKDETTGNLITDNVTIAVSGIGSFTTINGTLYIENQTFISQDYTVYASSDNFTSNQKTFTFTNQENLAISIFLIPKEDINLGNIFVNVYDSYLDVVAGADLRLQKLNVVTSSFEEISRRTSSSAGESAFQVLLNNEVYRIYATYTVDGIIYEGYSIVQGETFYADGQTVPIYLDTIAGVLEAEYNGLTVNVTNTALVNNASFHEVTYYDSNGLDHTVCLEYFYKNGLIKTSSTIVCDTDSSGTINYGSGYAMNRSYTWVVDVYVKEGDYRRYEYSETYDKGGSFSDVFAFILKALIGALFIGSLALALYLNRIDYFVYLAIFWCLLWVAIAKTYVSAEFTGLMIVLGYFVLTLAKKKNNSEEE